MTLDPVLMAQAAALGQVVLIDVTLAGDNAVVAGLPRRLKARAILIGIVLATAIRVALSLVAVQMLAVIGLTLAGGLLLLWVCWKMFRELTEIPGDMAGHNAPRKTLGQAIWRIAIADLSMSLDNVLAVAGAAHAHVWIMVAGLGLSVLLMGAAAAALARLLERQRWIAWLGLLVVVYVAGQMIWQGWGQIAPFATPYLAHLK
jgi:YjbE family integral membrane protein